MCSSSVLTVVIFTVGNSEVSVIWLSLNGIFKITEAAERKVLLRLRLRMRSCQVSSVHWLVASLVI